MLRRTTFLLASTKTNGLNAGKSREKSHFLSLKSETPTHCDVSNTLEKKKTISSCLIHLNFSIIPFVSLSFGFLTHGLI